MARRAQSLPRKRAPTGRRAPAPPCTTSNKISRRKTREALPLASAGLSRHESLLEKQACLAALFLGALSFAGGACTSAKPGSLCRFREPRGQSPCDKIG